MPHIRFALYLLSGVAAAVFLSVALEAPRSTAQPLPGDPEPGPGEIVVSFPTAGPAQTQWKVRWATANPGAGLVIAGAWFKKSPQAKWLQVIHDLRLSEIFVPYHNGSRIYDIGARGFPMAEVSKADAGPKGELLMAPDPKKKAMKPYVVKEIRDTGPLFKFYQRVRRGEALVLWGVIGAANYNYIVEYGFRDDGTITCRLGASGQNFGGHYTVAHMHNGCWRIDMDLAEEGAMNNANSVKVIKHLEPVPNPVNAKETARVIEIDFNNGLEGGMEWNPREFSHLRVVANGLNNKHGHPVGYDLLPYIRSGTPRHFGKAEEFTRYDFWVTPFDMKEQYYVQLPKYCSRQPKRNILGTDVVIWYMSPMHHIPRDEDGIFPMEKGRPVRQGVTLTMWGGFDLRPRNVFEATPLY